MKNKIFITNEKDDISIEMTLQSDSAGSPEELIVRSIKALVRTLDAKDYARFGKSGRAEKKQNGSGSRTRTCDRVVNSHLLYRLSYAGATECI